MVKNVTGKLLRMSFKPKFVLIDLVRFFVAFVLILYTVSAAKFDKGSKLLKAVSIVKGRKGIFSLIIQSLKSGIGQKLDIGPIEPKRVPFR